MHPPLNSAKSLDYLIKEWQALENLIKTQTFVWENRICLGVYVPKQIWQTAPALPQVINDKAGEHSGPVLETCDNWCLSSSLWDKDRNSGALQQNNNPRIDLSMCASMCACFSLYVYLFFFCFFLLPESSRLSWWGIMTLSEYCQENIKD